MAQQESTKRWLSIGVVALGALATIATSAPEDHEVRADDTFELAAYEVAYVEVTFDVAAMDHARRFPEATALRLESEPLEGQALTVADDGAFPAQPGRSVLLLGLDACPDEGPCTLGLSLEEIGGAGALVFVSASLQTNGDPRFVLPEARDYPLAARVTIERAP